MRSKVNRKFLLRRSRTLQSKVKTLGDSSRIVSKLTSLYYHFDIKVHRLQLRSIFLALPRLTVGVLLPSSLPRQELERKFSGGSALLGNMAGAINVH